MNGTKTLLSFTTCTALLLAASAYRLTRRLKIERRKNEILRRRVRNLRDVIAAQKEQYENHR